jgi:hypothetical protein
MLYVGVNIKRHDKSAQTKSQNSKRPHAYHALIFRSEKQIWDTKFGGEVLGDKREQQEPKHQNKMTALQVQHQQLEWKEIYKPI